MNSLPPEPPLEAFRLDADAVIPRLAAFIREQVSRAGKSGVVIGMSGGIDSSVVAHLAVRALGAENVHGYIMPFKTSSHESLRDAHTEIDRLGMPHYTIDITPVAKPLFQQLPSMDRRRRGNAMARLRMIVLYDRSEEHNALVIGTSNRTETLLGYGTLHGDAAWGINPIGNLYKIQVRQLASSLGVDPGIITKAPTADLWAGQTDEGELGHSYELIDRVLYLMFDRGASREQIASMGYSEEAVDRVAALVAGSQFKRRLPPVATL